MKSKIIIGLLLLTTFGNYAQQAGIALANKKYGQFAYVDAIRIYERIAEKGHKSADMFQKLGDAYYFNAQHDKAAKWYGELFKIGKKIKPEYYYRYAQSLKSVGDYTKSDEMMTDFASQTKSDKRSMHFIENRDYLTEIKANSGRYIIKDAGINSAYSDYGAVILDNKLVFASARDTGGLISRKHKWTNQSFTSLYAAERVADSLGKPAKFAKNVNSRFHEATPVFSNDGTTMYFTRNNFNDGKKGKNSKKITLLKIYRATLTEGKWDNVKELPFNSDNYSTAHPALSRDGSTLYFVSDMPGSIGQSDLYRVEILADGKFGKPENLGPAINTEGRETFPTIIDDELYFATDGRPGLGGLDIYVSAINADGTYSKPQNIGEPANSPKDDFSYLIDPETRIGYLTSNRDGGKGYDDIYRFTETRKLTCEHILAGTVTDFLSKELIPRAKISLFDQNFTLLKEIHSDQNGFYTFAVNCGTAYYVRAEKELYNTSEKPVMIPAETGKTTLPLELSTTRANVSVGTDLAKVLDIKIIYFDLDKWDIREDAALELQKVAEVLKEYPTMKIDIRSHTDSRQSHKYNQELSDKRANSTLEWLVSNGIDRSRLSGKGFGESNLLNNCKDGVSCSEEEHQQNRRSEFIVTNL